MVLILSDHFRLLGWVLFLIPRLERRREAALKGELDLARRLSFQRRLAKSITHTRGVCVDEWGDKHSVTHASRHIPEAQDAFKDLMIR